MHDRIAIAIDFLTDELKEARLERRRHLVTKEDLLVSTNRIIAAIGGADGGQVGAAISKNTVTLKDSADQLAAAVAANQP